MKGGLRGLLNRLVQMLSSNVEPFLQLKYCTHFTRENLFRIQKHRTEKKEKTRRLRLTRRVVQGRKRPSFIVRMARIQHKNHCVPVSSIILWISRFLRLFFSVRLLIAQQTIFHFLWSAREVIVLLG